MNGTLFSFFKMHPFHGLYIHPVYILDLKVKHDVVFIQMKHCTELDVVLLHEQKPVELNVPIASKGLVPHHLRVHLSLDLPVHFVDLSHVEDIPLFDRREFLFLCPLEDVITFIVDVSKDNFVDLVMH